MYKSISVGYFVFICLQRQHVIITFTYLNILPCQKFRFRNTREAPNNLREFYRTVDLWVQFPSQVCFLFLSDIIYFRHQWQRNFRVVLVWRGRFYFPWGNILSGTTLAIISKGCFHPLPAEISTKSELWDIFPLATEESTGPARIPDI